MTQALFITAVIIASLYVIVALSVFADVRRRAKARRGKRTAQEIISIISEVIG